MKIGLDLDGTVYAFPDFFREFILAMSERGHTFFCTSGHARREWVEDSQRLLDMGIDPNLISPDLMYPDRNPHVEKKGHQADQLDMVFEDDGRVQRHTSTPIVCMPNVKNKAYNYQRWE